ncbi:hypothetical protein Gasu2_12070 [Galdieria sulphuraria]|nr:hypothetical protein Gasu2_12070 [Galdieria sulphuraria]
MGFAAFQRSYEKYTGGDPSRMQVSVEKLDEEQVPLHKRDYCAHLYIPLRRCLREHYLLPWSCEEEKEAYVRCQRKERRRRERLYEKMKEEGAKRLATENEGEE